VGSITVVLLLLAVGVLLGKVAGRSLAAQYLLALAGTLLVSSIFYLIVAD
jgi:K+ transporter